MGCICISQPGASTDGVNLLCRAETRLVLTGVEPGQDTVWDSAAAGGLNGAAFLKADEK